jgi:hypothetical protein
MDLSIIIVNWNSKQYLRKCLASVFAETQGLEFEVIVIDSASFDGCERMLREEYPHVRFIQSTANLGFARANNLAFASSQGKAVLFLNPDTEVVGPAIRLLYEQLMTLPDAGAVGCKLLNSDGSLQTSCIQSFPTILNQVLDAEVLRRRFPRSRLWGMAPLFSTDTAPQAAEAISGACVMLKRDVFESVGRFSQDYFMYGEDIDLSYKVQQAGYKNHYLPQVTVIHHGGSSVQQAVSNFSVVMMREAIWRFLRKTRGSFYAGTYRVTMLISSLSRLLALVVTSSWQRVHVRVVGDQASMQKWRAVLRWTLNMEGWTREYYSNSDLRANPPRKIGRVPAVSLAASQRGDI